MGHHGAPWWMSTNGCSCRPTGLCGARIYLILYPSDVLSSNKKNVTYLGYLLQFRLSRTA